MAAAAGKAPARAGAAPVPGALDGLRVLEITSVVSGPAAGKYLADFGADVIKIEPPAGDGTRKLGWTDPGDGTSFFFKLVNRGKRSMVLDLKSPAGHDRVLELLAGADVLIENMRPGRLENLGLRPAELLRLNQRLVILRLSGFGQDGPLAQSPGFATTAEAMSGLASIMGEPGRGPSLPPIALADEVAGLAGALSVMIALYHVRAGGPGQVVDVSLLESVLQILGPLPAAWAHLGYLQERLGSGLPYSVPRGTYETRDNRWLAVSTSTESVARRVLALIGLRDPRYGSFEGRYAHRREIDQCLTAWVAGRDLSEALQGLRDADAAVAPVLTMRDVAADPHVASRSALIDADGVRMQAPVAKMSVTPGYVRHAGVRVAGPADGWYDRRAADG